jgi:hypothetical protein
MCLGDRLYRARRCVLERIALRHLFPILRVLARELRDRAYTQ